MDPLKTLYDTNIVIDFLRQIPAARAELTRNPPAHISIVTWIEVMAGTAPHLELKTRETLAGCIVVPLTPEIAERSATLRRQTRLKLPDAIILATAQQQRRTLITRNTRDFSTTAGEVHIPYTL